MRIPVVGRCGRGGCGRFRVLGAGRVERLGRAGAGGGHDAARLAHAHANWGFDAAGTYTITFSITGTLVGGGTISSGAKQFTFQVLAG
jgi:surface-anchored protein